MILILTFKNAVEPGSFNPPGLKAFIDKTIKESVNVFQEQGGLNVSYIGPDPHMLYEMTPEVATEFIKNLQRGFDELNADTEILTIGSHDVALKYHLITDESVADRITCTAHVYGEPQMIAN